jgi:hypothetical protein
VSWWLGIPCSSQVYHCTLLGASATLLRPTSLIRKNFANLPVSDETGASMELRRFIPSRIQCMQLQSTPRSCPSKSFCAPSSCSDKRCFWCSGTARAPRCPYSVPIFHPNSLSRLPAWRNLQPGSRTGCVACTAISMVSSVLCRW